MAAEALRGQIPTGKLAESRLRRLTEVNRVNGEDKEPAEKYRHILS